MIRNNIIIEYLLAWYKYEYTIGWEAHCNYGYDRNSNAAITSSSLELELRSACKDIGCLLNKSEQNILIHISRETRCILAKKFLENMPKANEILQKYIDNYNLIG